MRSVLAEWSVELPSLQSDTGCTSGWFHPRCMFAPQIQLPKHWANEIYVRSFCIYLIFTSTTSSQSALGSSGLRCLSPTRSRHSWLMDFFICGVFTAKLDGAGFSSSRCVTSQINWHLSWQISRVCWLWWLEFHPLFLCRRALLRRQASSEEKMVGSLPGTSQSVLMFLSQTNMSTARKQSSSTASSEKIPKRVPCTTDNQLLLNCCGNLCAITTYGYCTLLVSLFKFPRLHLLSTWPWLWKVLALVPSKLTSLSFLQLSSTWSQWWRWLTSPKYGENWPSHPPSARSGHYRFSSTSTRWTSPRSTSGPHLESWVCFLVIHLVSLSYAPQPSYSLTIDSTSYSGRLELS